MTPPVALILGVGPRIGAALVSRLSSAGYSIALASRSGTNTKDASGHLSLKADFASPTSVPPLFTAVQNEYKTAPSLVIYNAASFTNPPVAGDAFSIPAEAMVKDNYVNVVTPYVVAQEAVKGWQTLGADVKKTFIYTGNILNVQILPLPFFLNGGVGKAGAAFWIGMADTLYKEKGYRFFYADERFPDGKAKAGEVDGPAHADFYEQLATQPNEAISWQATFVKGKGYVKF